MSSLVTLVKGKGSTKISLNTVTIFTVPEKGGGQERVRSLVTRPMLTSHFKELGVGLMMRRGGGGGALELIFECTEQSVVGGHCDTCNQSLK